MNAPNRSRAGVGWSNQSEAGKAGQGAIRMALAAAGHEKPVAVIVYMTVLYDPKAVLAAIRQELADPNVPIIGSSTQGITHAGVVTETDRVLGVTVICSDTVRATAAIATDLAADPSA